MAISSRASVPADPLELASAFGASSPERIKQPVWVILAIEIPRYFAAQKSARDRMRALSPLRDTARPLSST